MRRRLYVSIGVVLAIVAATVAWSWSRESNSAGKAVEDVTRDSRIAPCPDLSGGPVAGGLPSVELPCMSSAGPATIQLSDYTDAKPMLIALWASYCSHCRDELKAIGEYHRTQPDGVRVLTVLAVDSESSAQLILDVSPGLPVAFDRSGQLFAGLRVAPALPVLVVVRPGGSVAKVYQGTPRTSADQVAGLVEQALRPTGQSALPGSQRYSTSGRPAPP
ncbi:TlpA disulfide reductase family protein [Dactylosporangium sp. CA-233914]|uniref:TlpA disulfide reductase family protein n=1 Tax=Dactylosporangium sp. CA-233914 TaxID=3239934 RepID=UPI003D8B5A64